MDTKAIVRLRIGTNVYHPDKEASYIDIRNINSFNAVLRINDVCTWNVSFNLEEGDPLSEEIVLALAEKDKKGYFSIDFSDSRDGVNAIFFTEIISSDGNIIDVDINHDGDEMVCNLSLECGLAALRDTAHRKHEWEDGHIFNEFETLITENSEFTLEGGETFPTQVGRINLTLSDEIDYTEDKYKNLTTSTVQIGGANLLDVVAEAAEASEVLFLTNAGSLKFFLPERVVHFRPQHFLGSRKWTKPEANLITIQHVDDLHNIPINIPYVESIKEFGIIERSVPSRLAKGDNQESEENKEKALRTQAALEGLSAVSEVAYDLEIPFDEGFRLGRDWTLGDKASVYFLTTPNDMGKALGADDLIISEVAIKIEGDDYSFRAGIGRLAKLLPSYLHPISKFEQYLQSENNTTPPPIDPTYYRWQ